MSFLGEALIFLLAAIVVVPICKRLGLSSVLGYLATGLVVGQSGLIGDTDGVLHFAEIGVVLLLFIIGLELQPRRLWVMRRAVFGLGSLQVGLTAIAIGALLGFGLGLPWTAAALVGFSLALSSTAFVLQLLGEQRKLYQPHGRASFGVLLLQDIAVIPAIAVLNLLAPQASIGGSVDLLAIALVVAGLVAARFTLRPALRFIASTGIHELFTAASLTLVAGAALGMQAAGLSMGLGAFVAGMMVADSEYRHQLETDVTPFKGLLLGLFFIAVGMATNLSLLVEMPLIVLGCTAALMLVKALALLPLALWHGMTRSEALRTAIVLSQGGEFAFVLLTTGASAMIISERTAEIAVLVVTLSMAATPLLVGALERLLTEPESTRPFDQIDEPENPVIIAGFGRVGQIVARVLTMRHIPFTALEANPSQVDFVRQFGNEIYFGDASRLDLLQAAHVAEARAFVLTLEDADSSLKIAALIRETYPKVRIFARARNRYHEIRLRELGVHFVLRDTLLSSLELTRELLTSLGLTADSAAAAVQMFREHDSRTLARQAAVFHDEAALRQMTRDAADELKTLFGADATAQRNEEPKARGGQFDEQSTT